MKFKVVQPNREVNVNIKSNVYYRLNRMFMKYIQLLGEDGFALLTQELEKAKNDESYLETISEESPAYHYMTMYYLLSKIEKSFSDAGYVDEVDKTEDELKQELEQYDFEVISESHETQQA